jgi:hypothetical protein
MGSFLLIFPNLWDFRTHAKKTGLVERSRPEHSGLLVQHGFEKS